MLGLTQGWPRFIIQSGNGRQIAELLKSDAENNSYDTAQFVLSFVQNVPYGTDENTTGTMNFPRYPVETLVDRVGDCKDHSALYASLMGAPSIDAGVVLIDLQKSGVAIGHMMVGLCLTGYDGLYVPYGGRDYFLCETTAPGWLIGQESPSLKGLRFKSCPLDISVITTVIAGGNTDTEHPVRLRSGQ